MKYFLALFVFIGAYIIFALLDNPDARPIVLALSGLTIALGIQMLEELKKLNPLRGGR